MLRPIVTFDLLILGFLSCSSPAAYTIGPQPLGALPQFSVTAVVRARLGASEGLGPPVQFKGTLESVEVAAGPGFRMKVQRDDGATVLVEIRTFVPTLPRLVLHRPVTISIDPGPVLLVQDELGPAVFVYSGPPSSGKDEPIRVRGQSDRIFVEVSSSEDLCPWTMVHGSLAFETADGLNFVLLPGEMRDVQALGHVWRVVAGDYSVPEESGCATSLDPRISFAWWRLT